MAIFYDPVIENAPVPPGFSTGLIPRDFSTHPPGCYAFAPELPDSELVPEVEWEERLAENRAKKLGLLDLRTDHYEVLHSLDQDGKGLCWAFSSTKAVMYLRAIMNASPIRLSAWWVAGVIKGWRDQGGWGAASLEKIEADGVPAESYCPSYKSSYDTPECRANAKLHRVTEWWDGSDNPDKAQHQAVSFLLKRFSCIIDLNGMGHSMCAIDLASVKPVKIIYDNSWGEQGDRGLYVGSGDRARPDGLVIPRVTIPSGV